MLHRHAAFELFRVDQGELSFYAETETGEVSRSVAAAGAVIAIPGGREHTVRNESDREARAFVVLSPGADMERFARAAGELAEGGSHVSPAEVIELAAANGVEITRPVPALPADGGG